ncbi:NAD(P)-dependent oxidoreductase [Marichromatium gracile]|uniref:NAD(P)-dependent oxidoreductase n=1 Tax=Marichromatium gracile TaxID=1048 RepID=UPI001F3D5BAC|nr:NAD(P)-dependent oxidoreductase [Marichromatium gracile]MCF1182872.1 NAD(P)-dependent oxidoreductase [Marichromatium gracile]
MTERIGFIGLGLMGAPMALNLLRAGHRLAVYARRETALAPLREAGAEVCASPAALAGAVDVVFTIVSDTEDVEQVLLGPDGVIEGARPGSVVVDMSTISASATRAIAARLAGRGVAMLDAPVSGGDVGAREGRLSIMVGGDPEVFARVRPLFEVLGTNIVHIGEHGAGQVCKACNQVVVGGTIAAVAEALLLARASGVDAARVREALLGGFAASRVLELHGQRMLDGDYRPGFKARLHRKDMRLVEERAREQGLELPLAAQVAAHLETLLAADGGELDSAAILSALERMQQDAG